MDAHTAEEMGLKVYRHRSQNLFDHVELIKVSQVNMRLGQEDKNCISKSGLTILNLIMNKKDYFSTF